MSSDTENKKNSIEGTLVPREEQHKLRPIKPPGISTPVPARGSFFGKLLRKNFEEETRLFNAIDENAQARVSLAETERKYGHLNDILDNVSQKTMADIDADRDNRDIRSAHLKAEVLLAQQRLEQVKAQTANPGDDLRSDKWEREKQEKLEEAAARAEIARALRQQKREQRRALKDEMFEEINEYCDDVKMLSGVQLDMAQHDSWPEEHVSAVNQIRWKYQEMMDDLDT